MSMIRCGVSLGLHPKRVQSREAILAQARETERLGFDSLWVGDHLAFVCLGPTYEAAVATATETLSLQYNQPFAGLVEKYCILGTPAQCREQAARFLEAGVRHLVFRPACAPGQERVQLRLIAGELLPALRRSAGA